MKFKQLILALGLMSGISFALAETSEFNIAVLNDTTSTLKITSDWALYPNINCPYNSYNDNSVTPHQDLAAVFADSDCQHTGKTVTFSSWYNVYNNAGKWLGNCNLLVNAEPLNIDIDDTVWTNINPNTTVCSSKNIHAQPIFGSDGSLITFKITVDNNSKTVA